ncbi:hypothetical protein [Parvibaculum sp.]|uniref:hypothetical protein n=1 Tax=Parvibaculum sp. TaxID=2024848 RepID=UPI001DDE05AB|nr:hypothetical protein [Parvibaculum sp.]MBX3488609.1 hypothetical protein [Parvibaculum sp.]
MIRQPSITFQGAPPASSGIDEQRRAPWLHNAYSESVWRVSDTRDLKRTATIDFRFRLADGRLLVDADRLCATIKEYAWWLRDPRFSRIDDAYTHASMVRNLMNLAHALTIRNIWSFAHLQPYDVEQLIEECRYGADAVLRASERLEVYLRELSEANAANSTPFGGLPRYVISSSGARTTNIHSSLVLAACNLPSNAKVLPRVAILIARAAKANGLKTRSHANNLKPLPNVSVQSMQRWLDPLEQLHAMRRRIAAEAISFKPFPRGAARVAVVKGVGVARTPIPPPMLALHLLEHSARWIFDRGQMLRICSGDRSDVFHMTAACWIVIAAFTARRDEEIDDLRDGCLRGDEQSGWWLNVYIEKTLQRKEWIPVPSLVARAVEVMMAISTAARSETGTDHLFQWLRPDGETMRLDVGRYLDEFAAAVKVPLHRPRGGPAVAWHWHPHQFRRFFAVLYFYRFEGATIEALSHHLRHFSLEMTKRYVTQDPEVAALWTDVEWDYTGHVARSIAAGERSVSGAAGERLKKTAQRLVDMFRRKLQIASPERVGASLALIMQRQGLVLTPKPWVTCSCPRTRDAATSAACRRQWPDADAVGPDFARAGPSVCSICPHAVTEGARQPFVNAEVLHLEAASASKPRAGTLFGALEEARMVELRQVRDARYDNASPIQRAAHDEEEKG